MIINWMLFAFYLSFTLTITIFNRASRQRYRYNLELFWSYKAIFAGTTRLLAENFWNVTLFFPMGVLISKLLSQKRVWLSVVIGFLLSSVIEVTQLVTKRGLFEFDDMIHNTLGTAIGMLVYLVITRRES